RPGNVTSLEAFFGPDSRPVSNGESISALVEADVILGHDWNTGYEFIVYGRAFLQTCVDTGKIPKILDVRVGLDADTEDLNRFLGLVVALKGQHECKYR